jgi:hypothetical protein
MPKYVGIEIVSVKYHVQTRRKSHDINNDTYTPWRNVYDADTIGEVEIELNAHLESGFCPECVRKIRRIILEEWI